MFSFFHHASDPTCNKFLNAFDLVRIHKFGHSAIGGDNSTSRSPSFVKMNSFVIVDEKVKKLITKEKIEETGIEFEDGNDWINKIEVNSKGEHSPSFYNFVLILGHDKKLNNIRYNVLSNSITVVGDIPWNHNKSGWSDTDFSHFKVYLSKVYNIYSPIKLKDALIAVADERAFHPIK